MIWTSSGSHRTTGQPFDPYDDGEFTTRVNLGEMNRLDLLTVLKHEVGPSLGHERGEGGVMQESLDAGTQRTVDPIQLGAIDGVDAVFALFALDTNAPRTGAGPFGFGRKKR